MMFKAIILCFLLFYIRVHGGYTISTIAGTGDAGFSGDGDSAIDAQLFEPSRVFISSDGGIYISDSGNSHIRLISSANQAFKSTTMTPQPVSIDLIESIAGDDTGGAYSGDNGPATSANLDTPYGVTLDSSGEKS